MDDLVPYARIRPTAERPLAGLTILLVEDSRYASDAVRLLCLRSGARLRRADCLASAARHLAVYRPDAALIDLGLPDGSGAALIADLAASEARPAAILGLSGGDPEASEAAARAAGADGFLAKPVASLAAFQHAILPHLPAALRPQGPIAVSDEDVEPDRLALAEDLARAAGLLDEDPAFAAAFVEGLARADEDMALLADALAAAATGGDPDRLRGALAARSGGSGMAG